MIALKELGKIGKAPAIWFEVAGYITTITELGEIFNIHHVTLRNRLKSGWNIAPACMVGNTANMTLHEVNSAAAQTTNDEQFVVTLKKHFGRPSLAMFK